MNFDQPLKQEVKKNLENDTKEGIDFVFEKNPELSEIGDKKQYSKYLDTVFSDSKTKDIVYHGTTKQFEEFEYGEFGIHFSTDIATAKEFKPAPGWVLEKLGKDPKKIKQTIHAVLLNITNLKEIQDDTTWTKLDLSLEERKIASDKYKSQYLGYDGLKYINKFEGNLANTYIVFEPEQIYILGSNQDIEGFKNFVSKKVQ